MGVAIRYENDRAIGRHADSSQNQQPPVVLWPDTGCPWMAAARKWKKDDLECIEHWCSRPVDEKIWGPSAPTVWT